MPELLVDPSADGIRECEVDADGAGGADSAYGLLVADADGQLAIPPLLAEVPKPVGLPVSFGHRSVESVTYARKCREAKLAKTKEARKPRSVRSRSRNCSSSGRWFLPLFL